MTSQACFIKPGGFSSAHYVLSTEMLSARSSTADKPQVVGAALVVCSQDPVVTLLYLCERRRKFCSTEPNLRVINKGSDVLIL